MPDIEPPLTKEGKALYWTLVVLYALLYPVFTIVAVNTLFGTTIPITPSTWAATCWLLYVATSGRSTPTFKSV